MGELLFGIVLPLAGIAIPVGAFVWEFVFVGRKRLGWRVQMDTPVTGEAESGHAGALRQLRQTPEGAERNLQDLSVVLVRIENHGATTIDAADYVTGQNGRAGLHLHFPQRRVIGMAVTELSNPGLAVCFEPDSGFGHRELPGQDIGVIDLPKVPLNRSDHYKILATLERTAGTGDYPEPTMQGVVTGGGITKTQGRSGASLLMLVLTGFLVTVIAAMAVLDIVESDAAPSGCATGRLTVVGSTAFARVVEEAGDLYERTCPGSDIDYEFEGSERGMARVDDARGADGTLLAIGDAPKGADFPGLVQRPLALSLFTVTVHPGTGVTDLTVEQIRDLFLGRVTNWRAVGGADLPVRVVNRYAGSGTRWNFETRLLATGQPPEPGITCNELARRDGPGRCQTLTTRDVLDEVAEIPGAVGYSEAADAADTPGVVRVTIGGRPATRAAAGVGSYPFWGVEYAYSYGDFAPGSIGASFARFLLWEGGQDVIRRYGNLPCAELVDPSRCHPHR
ncbi:substrate-binding domain-containing protein [Nocardia flavorosea]|uniref:PstS family phosphate ABC transporter substrate-binding protein n=1 Tax=Nocardia flavorosea TaxID=53429 RepID=UPI001894AF98|nr:substrate-binding domain-containing protein [Nocardia flavorosea]MBF6348925.1 substrate-binding domain-containing protein [Nocardia flavorosea]